MVLYDVATAPFSNWGLLLFGVVVSPVIAFVASTSSGRIQRLGLIATAAVVALVSIGATVKVWRDHRDLQDAAALGHYAEIVGQITFFQRGRASGGDADIFVVDNRQRFEIRANAAGYNRIVASGGSPLNHQCARVRYAEGREIVFLETIQCL